MPSPEDRNSTTVVIELEPGWIYVKIAEPKPELDLIERLLRRTIDHWFNAHPQFVIDKAQAITDHGIMQGIHVWYHVNDRQPEPVSPEPPQQTSRWLLKCISRYSSVFQWNTSRRSLMKP